MKNKQCLLYLSFFLMLLSCSRVSIPTKEKDAAPLLSITAIDRTHNTSTEHRTDRDIITVPAGTVMQFVSTAYNSGGVKEFTFKMSDNAYVFHRDDTPDGSGKVLRQLAIALENGQPITNAYTQAGQIFEVTATAVNFNAMLNSISLKIKVDKPTDPYSKSCGAFSFESRSFKNADKDFPQLRTRVNFDLDTAICYTKCSCQQVAFVQMIRFTDQTDEHAGENFQPSGEQESRMIRNNSNPAFNGWAIDRSEGRKWGYVARNNDDTWDKIEFDPLTRVPLNGFIQLGSNTKDAIFIDGINSDRSKYRIDVLTVPVCIEPNSTCKGQILGYFGFSFARIENADVLTTPIQYTYNWMPEAFDLAVAEWNKQSGKEPLNLQRMP